MLLLCKNSTRSVLYLKKIISISNFPVSFMKPNNESCANFPIPPLIAGSDVHDMTSPFPLPGSCDRSRGSPEMTSANHQAFLDLSVQHQTRKPCSGKKKFFYILLRNNNFT